MNTMTNAKELLAQPTPSTDLLPERIEALNLASFDVADHIRRLKDEAGRIEETATAEANTESNADKRKARRAELLRLDETYEVLQDDIRAAERVKVQLDERSHRFARERTDYNLHLEIRQLGRRAA